ncbi:MAG: phosphopyruvate hydratase [Candidatus Woesearchaeota archaeon]
MEQTITITKVHAREILDSRGNPTLEVELTSKNVCARAAVPSGASTGSYEVVELRDQDPKRYDGKGVQKAVNNVKQTIAKAIVGKTFQNQLMLDQTLLALDGTPNKQKLGANAILGVSLAAARLGAMLANKPLYQYLREDILKENSNYLLPIPCMNIINGGKHAANQLQFQELMIAPLGKTFAESLRIGAEIYHELKKHIEKKYGKDSCNVGDEGGFAPQISTVEEGLQLITSAIAAKGYKGKVMLCIDAAASECYDKKKKQYYVDGAWLRTEELTQKYLTLIKKYPIVSIEDPFYEEDFAAFATLKKRTSIQIVGDDLLVTNPERIARAITEQACNALLLKVNQIGTLSQALEAAKLATMNGWKIMVSHRSGETGDDFIADLAVALGCGQIKSGAPARYERLAKYNQLLRIEEALESKARYPKQF